MVRIGIPDKRYTVGIGYIVVPSNANRDEYILNSLRKEEVCILTQDGSFISKVLIDRDCLQRIEFPIDNNYPGSCVVYINEFIHNQPIVVAVLSKGNENQLLDENQFKLYKKTKLGIVSIVGDGNKGNLFVQLNSEDDIGGDFYIDLLNNSKTSKFILNVKGEVVVNTTGNITLNSEGNTVLNSDGNIDIVSKGNINISVDGTTSVTSKGKVSIDSDNEIDLGASSLEKAVLGDKLKKFMDDFITEVSNITVQVLSNPMPILNKVAVEALKLRTEEFLSSLNKLE
jgi:hypothetical protein